MRDHTEEHPLQALDGCEVRILITHDGRVLLSTGAPQASNTYRRFDAEADTFDAAASMLAKLVNNWRASQNAGL